MPRRTQPIRCSPPGEILTALAASRLPFLLESATSDDRFGRFSFAGCDPFLTVLARGDRVEIEREGRREVRRAEPLDVVRELLREYWIPPEPNNQQKRGLTPFPAGAVGWLSYDLGRRLEKVPEIARDDLGLPDLFLAFHDRTVTFDHATSETFLSSTGLPERGAAAERRARDRAEDLRAILARARPPRPGLPVLASTLRSTFSRDDYLAAVSRVKELIAAGDAFQVNLSQRFSTETAEPGPDLYARLVRANPASFAAYLAGPEGTEVLSASPERFFRMSGDRVEASPIKGTRPRGRDRAEDRRLARELLASEKDRAELTMIVDLLRSDLGRVARFGSVAVTELPALTSHPTVHHLHGTVTARLAEGRDVVDLLRFAFPCGSVTGAPKVRAMEIIEELEPFRRGVYTGSVGYFSFTGDADLNVAIRTLVAKDGRASFSVGGGIVADSEPKAEYEETLQKGRGLARALGYSL